MKGSDLPKVLKEKDIHYLFHANTVTTSCTFLKLKGLASRGHVEDLDLSQTSQPSDDIDKKFGIWYDIFTDTVDIHHRASKPNEYGPVLFTLSVDILDNLPKGTEVLVTKDNPIYWNPKQPDKWWISSIEEIRRDLVKGEFKQMIVFRIPGGILPFPSNLLPLKLDDPKRKIKGVEAYEHAVKRLVPFADKIPVSINKRNCTPWCKCIEKYKGFSQSELERYFE